MSLDAIIVLLIVGAIAGWAAGQIVKGYGFGLVGNIVVGVIGAFIAGWLLPRLGIYIGGGGLVSQVISAIIGAVILLFLLGLVRR